MQSTHFHVQHNIYHCLAFTIDIFTFELQLTITSFSVAIAVNMSLLAFTVVTVTVRSLDDTSRALGLMTVPVTMSISISFCGLDVKSHENHKYGQKREPRLHLDDVDVCSDLDGTTKSTECPLSQ